MKKFLKLILIIFFAVIVFSINECNADEGLKTETIEVTAPSTGVYGVGQEITIKFTYNQNIKGNLPNLLIYFGKTETNAEIREIEGINLTEFTKYAEYKYTIKSGDNGELKLKGFKNSEQYSVQTESGSSYSMGTTWGDFENKIYADTTIQWADLTNKEIVMKPFSADSHSSFSLEIDGFTPNENNSYWVNFSHQQEEFNIRNYYDISNLQNEGKWQASMTSKKITITSDKEIIFAEVGDVYATICEIDYGTNIAKIIKKNQKIEKMPQLSLTQRITAYFHDESTSTTCWEYYGDKNRKINYKIGKVTDTSLINKIKNNDKSSFQELLNYAKSNEAKYNGTLPIGLSDSIVKDMDLKQDELYFVYLSLDTENGKYNTIEDINLAKASKHIDGTKSLYQITEKDFSWDNTEVDGGQIQPTADKPVDNTVANKALSDAGKDAVIIGVIVFLSIVGIIVLVKYRKYKDIK